MRHHETVVEGDVVVRVRSSECGLAASLHEQQGADDMVSAVGVRSGELRACDGRISRTIDSAYRFAIIGSDIVG